MKYLPVNEQLFTINRKNFVSRIKSNSIAIFHSNDEYPRNGDQSFIFKQNPDFYYLTGIDQEQSILVLYPDCPNHQYREVLFLRQTNEHIAVWEGHKYTKEEARRHRV
jgi:Xaa-Pro aminopeptidase